MAKCSGKRHSRSVLVPKLRDADAMLNAGKRWSSLGVTGTRRVIGGKLPIRGEVSSGAWGQRLWNRAGSAGSFCNGAITSCGPIQLVLKQAYAAGFCGFRGRNSISPRVERPQGGQGVHECGAAVGGISGFA